MGKILQLAQTFRTLYTGKYAVVTNTVTAGAMGCFADAVAQTVEMKTLKTDRSWDFDRTRNMTVVSTAFGPLVYYWYRYLDNKFPGKSRKAVTRKVGLDLFIAPIWYGFFIGGVCLLKTGSFETAFVEYKEKAPILLGIDLVLWPVFQALNFLVFPPHFRIIGVKCNEIVMGIFTSHFINNDYKINRIFSKFSEKKKGDD